MHSGGFGAGWTAPPQADDHRLPALPPPPNVPAGWQGARGDPRNHSEAVPFDAHQSYPEESWHQRYGHGYPPRQGYYEHGPPPSYPPPSGDHYGRAYGDPRLAPPPDRYGSYPGPPPHPYGAPVGGSPHSGYREPVDHGYGPPHDMSRRGYEYNHDIYGNPARYPLPPPPPLDGPGGPGRSWDRDEPSYGSSRGGNRPNKRRYDDDNGPSRNVRQRREGKGGKGSRKDADQKQFNKQISNPNASVDDILDLFESSGHDFNDINLATALHRIGQRMKRLQVDRRLEDLLAAAEESLREGDWGARSLANMAWGMGKMKAPSPSLWRAIAEKAPPKLRDFKPQELSNIVWAFAAAGEPASKLFAAIAEEAPRRLNDFNQQDLTNTVWAYARAGESAPELFKAVAKSALWRIGSFSPQGLSNTAGAFASAGESAPELFEGIAPVALERLKDFKAKELATLTWAFAKVNAQGAGIALLEAIAVFAPKRVEDFKSPELANLAWAFATVGLPAEQLLRAIALEAPKKVDELNPQNLSNIAWAFAKTRVPAEKLFQEIKPVALPQIRDFSLQDLENMRWAFEQVRVSAPELLQAIMEEENSRDVESPGSPLADGGD